MFMLLKYATSEQYYETLEFESLPEILKIQAKYLFESHTHHKSEYLQLIFEISENLVHNKGEKLGLISPFGKMFF